jgi:hypothetical protein
MRKWLVWSTLLLVGCAGCSPEGSVGTASPLASPTATAKCQLPVFLTNGNRGDIVHGPNGAGFVGFPGGDFSMDPTGNLSPYFGLTYDWTVHKWLPIWPDAVAPDGLSYVIPNNDTAQWDLVDARNDSHRALVAVKDWNARSYQKEGIYLDKDGGERPGPSGLWLLDPSTGVIRQITSQGPWTSIGVGAAWGFEGLDAASKTLRRVDLKSGEITVWHASDGVAYEIYGRDQVGRPLLAAMHTPRPQAFSPVDLYELVAPGELVKITSTNGDALVSLPVSDQHGIWFAIGTVIWLYSKGSLHEVATLPGNGAQPAGSAWVQVTGNCSSRPA